jgi:hypothetical protein
MALEQYIDINGAKDYISNHVKMRQSSQEQEFGHSVLWISGSPGIGKSDLLEQICRDNQWGLSVAYVATMQLEQVTGLPRVSSHNPLLEWFSDFCDSAGKITVGEKEIELPKFIAPKEKMYTEWSLPELFSFQNLRVLPKHPDKDPMILLLDDAHLINKAMQGYMFQLLTYRSIHGHKLPDNVSIIMAGNRSDDKAGFQQILAPVANRIFFIDVKNEAQEWVRNYAVKNDVRNDIISFIQYYPKQLQSTPMESRAWASPRSWTYASRTLDEYETNYKKLDNEVIFQIMKGHVGDEYATKFLEYRTLLMQWDCEGILTGKTKVDWDKIKASKIDAYALLTACTNELMKRLKPKKFKVGKEDKVYVDGYKIIIDKMTEAARAIVPLGLKMLIFGEKEVGSIELTRSILKGNPIMNELSKII